MSEGFFDVFVLFDVYGIYELSVSIREIRVRKRNICGLRALCVILEVFESFDVY